MRSMMKLGVGKVAFEDEVRREAQSLVASLRAAEEEPVQVRSPDHHTCPSSCVVFSHADADATSKLFWLVITLTSVLFPVTD